MWTPSFAASSVHQMSTEMRLIHTNDTKEAIGLISVVDYSDTSLLNAATGSGKSL
jgi:hypothetical protein